MEVVAEVVSAGYLCCDSCDCSADLSRDESAFALCEDVGSGCLDCNACICSLYACSEEVLLVCCPLEGYGTGHEVIGCCCCHVEAYDPLL